MALIRRDVNVIYEASKYLQESNQNLILAKTKLMTDLENMFNNYQGIDANSINSKFIEAINKVDSLIERVDYYSKYMDKVTKHDQENIQNTTKELTTILNNAPESHNSNINPLPLNTESFEDNNLDSTTLEVNI